MIPFSLVIGQEKKSEQKIKIIVDDGSGTKVVIDTIYYNSPKPDSIKLSDGTVIYMKQTGDERNFKHHEGRNHIIVTASSDGKGDSKAFKEVTVVSSDSLYSGKPGDSTYVVKYYNTVMNEGKGGEKYKVITRKSGAVSDKGEVICINKGINHEKEPENNIDMYVSDSSGDSTIEKSRYVIALDGMVVTIEGNDEAKTKELANEIESRLGVKSEGTQKKGTAKVESKKTVKK